jgi:sialic acid synthase SpsE
MEYMIFVVAEIGVNWDGDFDLAQDMMQHAKTAGCNAVKFQAYDESIVKNHPQHIRLMKSAIDRTNIETINEYAKKIGIEWFCTPMYSKAVELLSPYVKKFKIREFDGRSLFENKLSPLLEKVLGAKKEIIISSQLSPKHTKYFENSLIRWLYCVPRYPCELNLLDFGNIKDFDGYSNHSPNIIAPLTAVILGAEIVEVHITSDKSKDFLDNNVSFDYSELNNLVSLIRQSEKIKK